MEFLEQVLLNVLGRFTFVPKGLGSASVRRKVNIVTQPVDHLSVFFDHV